MSNFTVILSNCKYPGVVLICFHHRCKLFDLAFYTDTDKILYVSAFLALLTLYI